MGGFTNETKSVTSLHKKITAAIAENKHNESSSLSLQMRDMGQAEGTRECG